MGIWGSFQFVVASSALSLSRRVSELASRRLELLDPPAPLGLTLPERWRMSVEQLCMYSEMNFRDPKDGKVKKIGFSVRHLSRARIMERPAWEVYKKLLKRLEIISVAERFETKYATSFYTDERGLYLPWSRRLVRLAFRAGHLQIPTPPLPPSFPADMEPPFIPEPRFTAAQTAQHRRLHLTQHRLVKEVGEEPPEPVKVLETQAHPEWLPEYRSAVGLCGRDWNEVQPRTDVIVIGGP